MCFIGFISILEKKLRTKIKKDKEEIVSIQLSQKNNIVYLKKVNKATLQLINISYTL